MKEIRDVDNTTDKREHYLNPPILWNTIKSLSIPHSVFFRSAHISPLGWWRGWHQVCGKNLSHCSLFMRYSYWNKWDTSIVVTKINLSRRFSVFITLYYLWTLPLLPNTVSLSHTLSPHTIPPHTLSTSDKIKRDWPQLSILARPHTFNPPTPQSCQWLTLPRQWEVSVISYRVFSDTGSGFECCR